MPGLPTNSNGMPRFVNNSGQQALGMSGAMFGDPGRKTPMMLRSASLMKTLLTGCHADQMTLPMTVWTWSGGIILPHMRLPPQALDTRHGSRPGAAGGSGPQMRSGQDALTQATAPRIGDGAPRKLSSLLRHQRTRQHQRQHQAVLQQWPTHQLKMEPRTVQR